MNSSIGRFKIGLAIGMAILLLAALTSFVDCVDRGNRGTVVISVSDLNFHSCSHERGPAIHYYSICEFAEHREKSGIKTFIVNRDGKIFQRNSGEKTSWISGGVKEFNPGPEWTRLLETGVSIAMSEQTIRGKKGITE